LKKQSGSYDQSLFRGPRGTVRDVEPYATIQLPYEPILDPLGGSGVIVIPMQAAFLHTPLIARQS
jgi:hypothetical protein